MVENKIAIELKTLLSIYEPSARLYYWRTSAGAEVDFIIERHGSLIPIEVKWRESINSKSLMGIKIFLKDFEKLSPWGVVLYKGKELLRLQENLFLVPFAYFLQ